MVARQSTLRMSDQVTHELLVRELSQVPEWDILGIYLGLHESEIKEIERDYQTNARRRLEMLGIWMKKDTGASWEKVIDALKSISQNVLANQLKEKYCTSQSDPPASGAILRADSSFEKELLVDRQEMIAQEIEDLEEKYLLLVTSAHSATAEANPSLWKLKTFSKFYKLTESTTVDELFDQLEPFYFLDYTMLEKMVKFFLGKSHAMLEDLRDYIEQLAEFKSSTTLKEFIASIEQAQLSHSTTPERQELCTVKLRLVGGWLTKTMDDLEKLVNWIFKDKVHVLSHLKIVRGSVIVTYCAPLSEIDSLVELVMEQLFPVFRAGVREIAVGDTVVTQSHSTDISFESSLVQSVQDNDLNLLSFLLDINTSPDAADEVGRTALMYASHFNRDKAISILLKANANPNLQDGNGATPLFQTSQEGHTTIVILLLNANADPNLQCNNGATPLCVASQEGHTDIVTLLLNANADPNLQVDNGATPLYIASWKGHTDTVTLLLNANADPNLQSNNGATPLGVASQDGHNDIVTLLLNANADPNLQADDGATPLYIASQNGHNDTVTLLLNANADPNLQAENGVTPLYIASRKGHTDIVTLLLNANADPNDGATPLHFASQDGHTDTVTLLLNANADPNLQADDGATPLHFASKEGHNDIVTLLLNANADPNLQAENGVTPLYIASQKGHTDIVTLLLNASANPNLQADDGGTPLGIATQEGHNDIVTLLLNANANPNLQAKNGVSPLIIASQKGHTDIVTLLLNANANPNLERDNGKTPLMVAAVDGGSQIVQLLLDRGADPNLKHSNGPTALMLACYAGYLESVELLLRYGADSSIKFEEVTALDAAASRGHKDIVDLLQAIKLSQSSLTSPVLTANEIADNVDNKTMALLNQIMEKMLVEKTETLITAEYQKHKKTELPPKQYAGHPLIK